MKCLSRDRPVSGAFSPAGKTCVPRHALRSRCGRPGKKAGLRPGFTLIEVVIAMAIFVIGAVAIVRIFTPALGVIQNSGAKTVAMRGTQSLMARVSTQKYGEPDWIYDGSGPTLDDANDLYDPTWNDATETFNGTVNRGKSLPADFYSIPNSALGKYHRIEGERQTVLAADGRKYVLTNFPYATPTNTITPNTATAAVEVYGEDQINGVRVSTDGSLDFTYATRASTGESFRDTTTGYEYRPPNTVRGKKNIYYISYSWLENYTVDTVINPTNAVIDEPYIFHPDVDTPGFDVNESAKVLQGRLLKHVIAGVVKVRLVEFLTVAGLDKTDSGTSVLTADDNLSGIATLNSGLDAGRIVYLSYNVLDWGVLFRDSVPNVQTDTANLKILTLPNRFDYDQDIWVRTILYPSFADSVAPQPTPTTKPALQRAYWNSVTKTSQGPAATSLNDIDRKASALKFDVSGVTAPRVRVSYRGLDSWAEQISVAARSYVPFYLGTFNNTAAGDNSDHPGNAPRQPWREYYWNRNDASSIFFRASEAGKTVFVTFINASNGRRESKALTIDDDVIDAPAGFAPAVAASHLTLIDSGGKEVEAAGILGIQGMSMQARTAWLEGGRFTQVVANGYRR